MTIAFDEKLYQAYGWLGRLSKPIEDFCYTSPIYIGAPVIPMLSHHYVYRLNKSHSRLQHCDTDGV